MSVKNRKNIRGTRLVVENSLTLMQRRIQTGDKKKDKHKDKHEKENRKQQRPKNKNAQGAREPATSPNPTEILTDPTREPTAFPTIAPSSADVTIAPSVTAATAAPTLAETEESSTDAYIVLQFSLMRDSGLKAVDVTEGREEELTSRVSGAILAIMCVTNGFLVEPSERGDLPSICRSAQTHQKSQSLDTIVFGEPLFHVEDKTSSHLVWTEWSVGFLVLQTGEFFYQKALEQLRGRGTSADVHDLARELMANKTKETLAVHNREGYFSELIGSDVWTSVVGEEHKTFPKSASDVSPTRVQPLDPKPFHGLRIFGIILFVANIALFALLINAAKRRSKGVEWDTMVQREHPGALSTADGLDNLLDMAGIMSPHEACSNHSHRTSLPPSNLRKADKETQSDGEEPSLMPVPVNLITLY